MWGNFQKACGRLGEDLGNFSEGLGEAWGNFQKAWGRLGEGS